ncbi:MAG: hypothetical protein ACXVB9_17255 [Bdellovibrionota bacterium]
MKFPKKLLPLGVAFPLCGFLVAASAFAAVPVVGGGTAPAKGTEGLSPYMVTAGSLDNAGYLACIQSHLKFPGGPNVVSNVDAALDCQTTAKN